MAAKMTFDKLMNMKEDEFITYVSKAGKMAELNEIAARTTKQKQYPKVLKPSRKVEGKMTYQADKTQKPKIVEKPITFFEVKTAFAKEVLKLEKKVKEDKPTFRDRIAAAAQNA